MTTTETPLTKTLGDDPRIWTVLWSDEEGNELLESEATAAELPEELEEKLWQTDLDWDVKCVVRGRQCVMRRGQRLFYDPKRSGPIDYPFAGQTLRGHQADAQTIAVLDLFRRFSPHYNAVLINDYFPKQSLGAHSDKQQTLCPQTGVIALSLCRPAWKPNRAFKLTCKKTRRLLKEVPTRHRQLLCMRGPTMQDRTKHAIAAGSGRRRSYSARVHAVAKSK